MEPLWEFLFDTRFGAVIALIQALIWIALASFATWRLFRSLEKKEKDNLRAEAEAVRKSRDNAYARIEALKKTVKGLRLKSVDHRLEKADKELAEGNERKAFQALAVFFDETHRDLAQLARRIAEHRLPAAVTGEDRLALEDAVRFSTLAALLAPDDGTIRRLRDEIAGLQGATAYARGDFTTADPIWDRVVGTENAGADSVEALADAAFRAETKGRHDIARLLWRRIRAVLTERLGPNHPDTLTSQNNLASALNDLGRYMEAEELHRRTWEARKAHPSLGPDHPETLMSQDNLAGALGSLGRHGEAEELHRRTWEAEKIHPSLGPDHPNTLTSQNNLASALHNLGRHDEAEALFRRTWEARKAHPSLGPERPDTLKSQDNLAHALDSLGRHDEAEALFRRTWEARKAHPSLGPDHPDTLMSQDILAHALDDLGRHDEAEAIRGGTST